MNKTGSFQGLIIALVVLFGIAIGSIIFADIFTRVSENFEDNSDLPDDKKGIIETVRTKAIPFLDYFVLFALFSLIIGLFISVYYLKPSLVTVFVSIIFIVLLVLFSSIFSDIYSDITSSDELSDTAGSFTKSRMAFGDNLPTYVAITIIGIAIILYGKFRA